LPEKPLKKTVLPRKGFLLGSGLQFCNSILHEVGLEGGDRKEAENCRIAGLTPYLNPICSKFVEI
jgi:hypothetical protein